MDAGKAGLIYPELTNGPYDERIIYDVPRLQLDCLPSNANYLVATIDWQSIEGFGLLPTHEDQKAEYKTPKGRVVEYPRDKIKKILLGTSLH